MRDESIGLMPMRSLGSASSVVCAQFDSAMKSGTALLGIKRDVIE